MDESTYNSVKSSTFNDLFAKSLLSDTSYWDVHSPASLKITMEISFPTIEIPITSFFLRSDSGVPTLFITAPVLLDTDNNIHPGQKLLLDAAQAGNELKLTIEYRPCNDSPVVTLNVSAAVKDCILAKGDTFNDIAVIKTHKELHIISVRLELDHDFTISMRREAR